MFIRRALPVLSTLIAIAIATLLLGLARAEHSLLLVKSAQVETPTETPTDTPTDTPTSTPTNTPTSTATNTATATATATTTATPTKTPPLGAYLPVIVKIDPPATPTPTTTPPPAGQIPNGTFELGRVFWLELTDFPYALIRTQLAGTIKPHGGIWATWLGGVYGTSSDAALTAIGQRVTVSSSKPYLTYWHWIASDEICGGNDVGGIGVDYGAPDADVVDVLDLCSRSNTGGWRRRVIDMRKYTGKTVLLIFLTGTDSTLNSNWFLDDVSFQAKATASTNELTTASIDSTSLRPHGARGVIALPQIGTTERELIERIRAVLDKQ